MSKKRSKKAAKLNRTSTSLAEHRRVGKTLQPPLAQLSITTLNWQADMLPEMLWTECILNMQPLNVAANIFHNTLDILDDFVPHESKRVLTGLISSFALIPEDRRLEAIDLLTGRDLYDQILPSDLRHGLALYSQCPMMWLLANWQQETHVDFEVGIRYLKGAVVRLFGSRGKRATRCRMLALARMIKHRKILFTEGVDQLVELLPSYSDAMAEDQQKHVESASRAMFSSFYETEDLKYGGWAPYFWRHNYHIAPCEFRPDAPLSDRRKLARDELDGLASSFLRFKSAYQQSTLKAPLDLYDLDKDEVLFGLTSRQFRLFSAIVGDPQLWTPDLGFMFHRVMADTQIVITWLISKNDPSLYHRFKLYSLGKQKLFKLHLEDIGEQTGMNMTELEDGLADRINEELWEELLPIELGAVFEGTDTRKMANDVGLDNLYHMVYSPASSELHGEWTSLKEYHLQRCGNPLHRFHWLPRFQGEDLLSPGIVLTASSILADTVSVWLRAYGLETEYQPIVRTFRSEIAIDLRKEPHT
jgi:hypothetical protein